MESAKRYCVLFLASWYPNRVLPKNGNFVRRHAQAVSRYADVVTLHVISDEQAADYDIKTEVKAGVLEVVVYYPKSTKWRPLQKYRKYMEAHRRGYAWITKQKGQIDITHLNVIYPAGLFALELKQQHGIPFVLTEHWTAFLSSAAYRLSAIEKYFIKKIGREVTVACPVSEDLKSSMQSFGVDALAYQVIPNVVDSDLFAAGESSPNGKIKIIHVSNFKEEQKNISGILRVISRLEKLRNDFEVLMVGNLYGDQFDSQIKQLGIARSTLRILPEIELDCIADYMRTHHIFLLFSNYENLPCVISEAHCVGMAVVSSDVGGIAEMIDESNGVIVPARDEDALFAKLNEVMDNHSKYDAKKIRTAAVERYSYDSVAKAYIEVYNKVLAKHT